jgi:hypothetical protein
MNISFINNQKGNLTLQLSPNITIKDMIIEYCKSIAESPQNFGKTIFLVYNNKKIDLNSQEQIGIKFKNSDFIYVLYEKVDSDNPLNKINEERRSKIRIRQKKSMNEHIENKEKIKDTLEDMALLGCIENQNIHEEMKKSKNKFISIKDCLKSNNDQFFILGILAKYLEKIGIQSVIERADEAINEIEQIDINVLLQFICNGYILKKKYILYFSIKKERMEVLKNNESERNEMNELVKKLLSQALKIKEEDLIVKEFIKNDKEYTIILVFKSNYNHQIKKNEFSALFKNNKSDLALFSGVQIVPIIEIMRLNKSMLYHKGNNKDNNKWGQNEMRGGEIYNPPLGWERYGLKVLGKYDNGNNDWLSYDNRPGEWCISYTGFSGFTQDMIAKIENDNDIKHPGNKVGTGVCTWVYGNMMKIKTDIIKVNGNNYKIGLMVRVKPDKIRCPETDEKIWVVNGTPDEIRPYGILLQKV